MTNTTCDNPPQSTCPPFLPAPTIPFSPWARSNHVQNINMLSPLLVRRFFRLTNHHVKTKRVRLIITRAVIFQSRLMIPSAAIVIVSFASLGIDNVSSFFIELIARFRWGHFSTVWLVKDAQSVQILPDSIAVLLIHLTFSTHRHSALKVVKSAGRYAETARDEIKLLSRVSSFSPSHPGRQHIVSFLDSFSHQGPEAQHICIVFEPLGENLLALIERNKKKGVPRSLVKVITRQILLGLEYLHDECDLVHTDIKPENIRELQFLLFPPFFFNSLSHRCPVHMLMSSYI